MFELKYQESADSLLGGKKLCIHFSVSGTDNSRPTVYTGVVRKETLLSPLLSVPQVYCGNVSHTGGFGERPSLFGTTGVGCVMAVE